MTASTLQALFLAIFSTDELRQLGRATQAFVRTTTIEPLPFVLGLLTACCSADERSIASAHRAFEAFAGKQVARSSFDERVDSPSTVALFWKLFAHVLVQANRSERRSWPREVQQFRDILVEDGTQVRVRDGLGDRLRSTTPAQSALKLLACLSLKEGCLQDLRLAAAIHHDAKLLRTKPHPGALYLRDLGFYDHSEFVAIEEADAFFVSLLKTTTKVVLTHVAEGLDEPSRFLGAELTDDLPMQDVLDVDGRFRVAGDAPRTFRVIGLSIGRTDRHGQPLPQKKRLWLVTNLHREQASAQEVAALYRLRYQSIERLFRRTKSLTKLRRLNSGRMAVILVFVLSSLLVEALAAKIAKQVEEHWGWGEVSADRVLKVVVGWMWGLGRVLCGPNPQGSSVWSEMAEQVLHWASHPNARQPSRTAQVLGVVAASRPS